MQNARSSTNGKSQPPRMSTRELPEPGENPMMRRQTTTMLPVVQKAEAPAGPVENKKPHKKLGVFKGVLVPTCENMWGVIIFLRFYTIVGYAGFGLSIIIVTLSFSVALLTALALSAIATCGSSVHLAGVCTLPPLVEPRRAAESGGEQHASWRLARARAHASTALPLSPAFSPSLTLSPLRACLRTPGNRLPLTSLGLALRSWGRLNRLPTTCPRPSRADPMLARALGKEIATAIGLIYFLGIVCLAVLECLGGN